MYRRKIGKKIFRRTRKHKFYGIKVKKGPSILTRKRIRRGGEGEEADVHSVIGNYAARSFSLDRKKCINLLNTAINAQQENPERAIIYTPNALGDKKYCDDKYKTYIDDNVSRAQKFEQEKRRKLQEEEELEQQKQQQQQEQQLQQDELARKKLEEERDKELKMLNPNKEQQIISSIAVKTDEEIRQQELEELEKIRKIELEELEKLRIEKLSSEDKNTKFYSDNPGFKKVTSDNKLHLSIRLTKYKDRLKQIYKMIYELVKLLIFNKQLFFINKLSTGDPGIVTVSGIQSSIFIQVVKLLEKCVEFIKYYNSAVSDHECFKINEVAIPNKVNGYPKFLDMEKVLKLLYNFYDICITDYLFYSLYAKILSSRLQNLADNLILSISGVGKWAISDVFRSLYLEYEIDNSMLSIDNSENLDDKKQNDINQLSYRLIYPFTPTKDDPDVSYTAPLKIDIEKDSHGVIKIQDQGAIKNIPHVLSELTKILRENTKIKDEYTDIVKVDRQFTTFIPMEGPFTVIDTKSDKYGLYYLDMINNIHNFLMKYNDIFCFSSSLFRGQKTKIDVRIKIQGILTPLIDSGLFDKLQLFDKSNFTPYMNPDTFNEIIIPLIKLLDNNTTETKTCKERTAVTRFNGYNDTYQKDAKSAYFLKIFLNMIIYACYQQRLNGNTKVWKHTGTDLMIIYMNIFILNYLDNILISIGNLLTVKIDGLLTKRDTYIFYDKMFTFIIPRVKEIQKNIETINLKKYVTFRKSDNYKNAFTSLPTFETTYRDIKNRIDLHNAQLLKTINFENYDEPYRNPDTSDQVGNSTYFSAMIEINLCSKKTYICNELIRVLTPLISTDKAAEIFTTSLGSSNSSSYTIEDEEENIKEKNDDYKEECKVRLSNLINKARKALNGVKYTIPRNMLADIEICADFGDPFDQKNNTLSGDREYIKRIGRAYYGIKELLLKLDRTSRNEIIKIPSVKQLFNEVDKSEELRRLIHTQCVTDKDEENKGVIGKFQKFFKSNVLFEEGPTDRRKHIRADLTDDQIVALCNRDVSSDVAEDSDDELVSVPVDTTNPELAAYHEDLNEGAKLANENARLRQQSAEENRKIIEDLKKYNSKDEMLADAKDVYKGLHSSIRAEIDAALGKKGSGFFSRLLSTGGSKRRGRTIKRRRRQQKQHKTKKHGRKYRTSRVNKKTRKHLVPIRGPGRIRPHRRTRSH